jgi:protease-4
MYLDRLSFQILRATWALEPRLALSFHDFVSKLFSRQFSASEITPKVFDGHFITENGDRIKMYEEVEKGASISNFDTAPKNSLAVIPLKGEMLKEDTLCSFGTETIAMVMREAAASKNIRGLVIDGDSGGGAVDSIAPLLDARNFIKAQSKSIVGIGDLIGSAAYYFYSSLDEIIASNDISSSFGSIGVMVSFADVQPYYESLGIKFHTIYAPESDAKNTAFELALKGDYDLIKKEMLSPLARKFQNAVRENRAGKIDIKQKGILNGKMFYAEDAVRYGLADSIGNFEYALERATQLANV